VRFVLTLPRLLLRSSALFTNPNVPKIMKVAVLVLALLIVSPLDILGDIPIIGALDDVVLLGILLQWFIRTAERHEPQAGENLRAVPVR